MNLNLTALEATVSAYSHNKVSIDLTEVDTSELNTSEVALCVDHETYFDAHGEDTIRAYVEKHYDWFYNE